jgi:histone deacetylase 11
VSRFLLIILGVLVLIQLFPFEWFSGGWARFGKAELKAWKVPANALPLFYSEKYNIDFWGLENLHPFDSKKYLHVFEKLKKDLGLEKSNFISPELPTWDLLSTAMSPGLFFKLQNPLFLMQYTELLPLLFMPRGLSHLKVVNPMRTAALGSVLAAKTALEKSWAINLSGGYHHADSHDGGGFCLIPDITLIIKSLREEKKLSRVMIVDLDAHQGNGHERDFLNDDRVFIFDMYNKNIYPQDEVAKQGIDLGIPLDDLTEDNEYLFKLDQGLTDAFERFDPELIIYNAGTDILIGDPLGSLSISAKGVMMRDQMVFESAFKHNVPIVMLLSGGYQKSNAEVIANSIENLWNGVLKNHR